MPARGAFLARCSATALSVCGGAALLTCALVVAGAPPASSRVQAQAGAPALGYNSCAGSECHTKNGEIDWLTRQPGGKEHKASFNSLKNAAAKSEKYAKAVGLAKFDEPTGMCVKCHATYAPTATPMLDGVTCESCHGPAKNWRTFHSQNPQDYAGSVQRGMRNLKGRPAAWVPVCKDCHVLDKRPEYAALLEEGHPAGDRWNVARKYVNVSTHWKKVQYTADMVAAGTPVTVATAPTPPAQPAPAAPPAPPVTTPGGTPPATPPPPPPSTPPVGTPGRGTPATVTGAGAVTGGGTRGTTPGAAPTTPPVKPTTPLVDPPRNTVVPPAITNPAPIADAPSPLALAPPAPVTASGLLAALQDRVEGLLESLLRRNSVPAVPLKPLGPPPVVSGPDAELLRLQYEALGLAVEALNLRIKPAPQSPPR